MIVCSTHLIVMTLRRKQGNVESSGCGFNHPSATILVAGNCDERGTREYNIGLGARRANASREYLISQGVNPQRITVTSYGKDRPTVPGSRRKHGLKTVTLLPQCDKIVR